MDCIEHGYFDLITAYAPQPLVYKRIANAIRAKDSLSLGQLEKMLKQLPSCIFLKDTEGKYVFSTQIWHHLDTEGDPNWTIRGKTDLEIRKDKANARKAMEADRRILESGEGTEYIIEENEDGIRDFLQLIKRPVYDEDGRISGIIALINNITDYQLLKMELEKRANTDALTGLLNKSASQDLIHMMLANYRKEGEHSALLMIDADHFKDVNDGYGHLQGDEVLKAIAARLGTTLRSSDRVFRFGGEEFVAVCPGTDHEEGLLLAERLRWTIATSVKTPNAPRKRYISITKGDATFNASRENIKLKPKMVLPARAARVAHRALDRLEVIKRHSFVGQ
jgi:diguanylate cyclase (GGDEF)-like protein